MAKKEAQKHAITDTDDASPTASGASEQGGEQSTDAPGASASAVPSDDLAPARMRESDAKLTRPTFDELRAAYADAPDTLLEARLLRGGPELRAGVVVTSSRWSRVSLRSVFEMSMSHVQALASDLDIEVRLVPSEA